MYIIPNPQTIKYRTDTFTITYNTRIVIDRECTDAVYHHARLLKKELERMLGYKVALTKGDFEPGCIYLKQLAILKRSEYTLSVEGTGILLQGGSDEALLYSVQTLRQIVEQEGACLSGLYIEDYPHIENRGYYLDVTRGRIPTLEYLKAIADKLSYYKHNQLQLYIEHSFLYKDLSEVWRDDTPLTAEEILELDDYCSRLHIELVPSIATFGHLHKLLSTKSYTHLCELPASDEQPFSFEDRMQHHTIDASNEESMRLIKRLIDEYQPLFRSRQFNICADETFDLGKGRTKALAEEKGVDNLYISYVKELCEYLIDKGIRPMFWGDIVCGFPEAIKQLPSETICLNWGYAADQSEEATRLLEQAGATQYLCPGVGGWNQFINLTKDAYENIKRMCSYAHKYQALGLLNTDWGDFGHINHPEFSTIGMIYGAAFSWNRNTIGRDEINAQISRLEYGDAGESFAELVSTVADHKLFEWYHIVHYRELELKGKSEEDRKYYLLGLNLDGAKAANEALEEIIERFYRILASLPENRRSLIKPYILAAEGIMIFNRIGATIGLVRYHVKNEAAAEPAALATQLEKWFYHYKEIWRSVSKESELYRLQELILWYADELRTLAGSYHVCRDCNCSGSI
jgi:hexosaminidase